MVNLPLSNGEWCFLHIQLEKLIKEYPHSHIAKRIFDRLVENRPNVRDIKTEFQREYDCVWVGENNDK